MADARVTQSAIELAITQISPAFVTQSVIEIGVSVGVSCNNPPGGHVGVFYTHTFTAGGGFPPYTFAIIFGSAPPGLVLNTATGVLSGTPTTPGTYAFTIQVTDSFGTTATANCSIGIDTQSPQKFGILLVGWKLYPKSPCDETIQEIQELPPVKRAV